MYDEILTIRGVPVHLGELPSGDLKVWHPLNEAVRALVEPICRGRGRWHPDYRNWIVFRPFKCVVVSELRACAER